MTLSLVIPSLGGPSLESTLEAVNAGTVVPDEILLCIPAAEAAGLRTFKWSNVRLIATECRGQVAQRAEGFKQAAHPLVMQLDDDLIVDGDCVERLRDALVDLGRGWAVSPALVDADTRESVYRVPARGGFVPGRIHRSGAAVGIDSVRGDREFYDVEWLPGGCAMHYRENLVLENFYPFPGKAYCEDIIHSFHLTSRGIRLRIISSARCRVDVPRGIPPLRDFVKDVRADLRARRYYMRLSSRRPAWVYAFVISRWLGYLNQRGRAMVSAHQRA